MRTMDYRYYVSDDLRLRPWKRKETVYSDLDEAIDHYLDLPPSVVKAIGLVAEDGLRVLELVRCLQLFPTDVAGESVFMVEPFFDPKWGKDSDVLDIGRQLVKRLDIRRCLLKERLIPIPTSDELPESMDGVYLWRDKTNDPESAIHQVYLAGEGWRSLKAAKRLYPDSHRTFLYPLVLMYRVDAVNAKNRLEELEVTPWDYELLNHRTEVRVIQNKKKQEEKR